MFDIETLKGLGLQGWPLVVAIGIVCSSVVALWHGRWPWSGIIEKYYYDCNCDCHNKDEENE